MESKNIIYGLCEEDGTVRYVGKSTSGLRRPIQHFCPKTYNGKNYPVYKWMKKRIKAGIRPLIKILAIAERSDQLDKIEIFIIAHFRSTSKPKLLNITDGGGGGTGTIRSEETKKLISEKKLRWYQNPENLQLHTDTHNSSEFKDKMSKIATERYKSEDSRKKTSAATKGKPKPTAYKPVVDNLGNHYPSVKAAAQAVGCSARSISAVARGRQKTIKGLTFTYTEDNNNGQFNTDNQRQCS